MARPAGLWGRGLGLSTPASPAPHPETSLVPSASHLSKPNSGAPGSHPKVNSHPNSDDQLHHIPGPGGRWPPVTPAQLGAVLEGRGAVTRSSCHAWCLALVLSINVGDCSLPTVTFSSVDGHPAPLADVAPGACLHGCFLRSPTLSSQGRPPLPALRGPTPWEAGRGHDPRSLALGCVTTARPSVAWHDAVCQRG